MAFTYTDITNIEVNRSYKKVLLTAGLTLLALAVGGLMLFFGLEIFLLASILVPAAISTLTHLYEYLASDIYDFDDDTLSFGSWFIWGITFCVLAGLIATAIYFSPALISLMSASAISYLVCLSFSLSISYMIYKINQSYDKKHKNKIEKTEINAKTSFFIAAKNMLGICAYFVLAAIIISNFFVPFLGPIALGGMMLALIGLNSLYLARDIITLLWKNDRKFLGDDTQIEAKYLSLKLATLTLITLLMGATLFEFAPLILGAISATTMAVITLVLLVNLIHTSIKAIHGCHLVNTNKNVVIKMLSGGMYKSIHPTQGYYKIIPSNTKEWAYLLSLMTLVAAIITLCVMPFIPAAIGGAIMIAMLSTSATSGLFVAYKKASYQANKLHSSPNTGKDTSLFTAFFFRLLWLKIRFLHLNHQPKKENLFEFYYGNNSDDDNSSVCSKDLSDDDNSSVYSEDSFSSTENQHGSDNGFTLFFNKRPPSEDSNSSNGHTTGSDSSGDDSHQNTP